MGIIIRYMDSFDIRENEERNSLQILLLESGGNTAALESALRSARELDIRSQSAEPLRPVGLAEFVEELCLAADFYLLPDERCVRLFQSSGGINALVPVRKAVRDFFFAASRLLRTNRKVTVSLFSSGGFANMIFESDSPLDAGSLSDAERTLLFRDFWLLVEDRGLTPALRFRLTGSVPVPCPADFSLMLCDRMSELNKWFFDI
jgi:hypothetical protein